MNQSAGVGLSDGVVSENKLSWYAYTGLNLVLRLDWFCMTMVTPRH